MRRVTAPPAKPSRTLGIGETPASLKWIALENRLGPPYPRAYPTQSTPHEPRTAQPAPAWLQDLVADQAQHCWKNRHLSSQTWRPQGRVQRVCWLMANGGQTFGSRRFAKVARQFDAQVRVVVETAGLA